MNEFAKNPSFLKKIGVTLFSILLFYLLGNYGRIHTGVFMSYIYLQYPLLCIVSILFGPVVGFITGLTGHILIDLVYAGRIWVSWEIGSGLVGLFLGLIAKFHLFKTKDALGGPVPPLKLRFRYACIVMGTNLLSFTVISTIIHMIVYSDPVSSVIKQAIFIGISNGLTSLIVTDLLFSSFKSTVLRRIVAILTVLNSLEMISYGNRSIGSLILYVITFIFALYLFFYKQWHNHSSNIVVTIFKAIVFNAIILYAFAMLLIASLAYVYRPVGNEKVAIVLGAGLNGEEPSQILKMRLDSAIEWFNEDTTRIIVTSGGKGTDEVISEGEAMKNYLVKNGIPSDSVLIENKSTTTEENFRFSLDVLKTNGYNEDTDVICITNNFHCFRAVKYAQNEGFNSVKSLASRTPIFGIIPNFSRECLALAKYVIKAITSMCITFHSVL